MRHGHAHLEQVKKNRYQKKIENFRQKTSERLQKIEGGVVRLVRIGNATEDFMKYLAVQTLVDGCTSYNVRVRGY